MDWGYYNVGRAIYQDWPTIHLKIELNYHRYIERLLDGHVGRSGNPDQLDAIQDILRERGVRFLPVVRARPWRAPF